MHKTVARSSRWPWHLLTSAAALVLAAAMPACARTSHAKDAAGKRTPSVAEAIAFVDKAEKALAAVSVYANKAQWLYETYINDDSSFLAAKAEAESTGLGVKYAKEAVRFDRTKVDPVTRRKLTLLKIAVTLPAPDRPGASRESADLQARLTTLYGTGTATIDGKALHIDELDEAIAAERDPQKSREIFEKWHQVAVPMQGDYAKLTALLNEGARELGYRDAGALWRAGYDMAPDRFRGPDRPALGAAETLLHRPALLRARQIEPEVRRRHTAQDRADPRRSPRQHVGAGVGPHLRRGGPEGRWPRL